MSDNATTAEITPFVTWWIPIISAFVGASIALIGKEIFEWYKRPRLVIDFERSKDEYPLIEDYNDESTKAAGTSFRIKFLRLIALNKGKTTAYDCDAKMELIETRRKTHYRKSLHWSKRDPRIYKSLDQIYSPINLNRNDEEPVDVLQLQYSSTTTDPQPRPHLYIETVSPAVLQLQSNMDFFIKVTIYARNTTSKPFYFKVNWDGTIEGFNKAFTKLNNIPKEYLY
ncbi:MAG: hypothetical protein MUO17_05685 [Dehalococcoidales bacterium]|nr:hypothetical protein [Dehalococcoidales bacterium]